MPSETESHRKVAKTLFSSLDDFLNVLPPEDKRGDENYREKVVSLEDWLYSPDYMNLLPTRLSAIQFEFLQSMDDHNPETNQLTEFVAEWGKGAGKDFICALACLRQVYMLLCLRNPYAFYGMARDTGIQLVNVAYTKDQAKHVFFKQLKGILKGSPWFLRRKVEITGSRIKFEWDIECVSTSADGDSAEGQNLFFALMDEASAFKDANMVKAMRRADGVKIDKAADAIYSVLRSSSRSRFPSVGKVVMISYPRYKDDFIQTKRKENQDLTSAFVSGPYATWEVNPTKKKSDFQVDYDKNPEKAAAMYECKPPFAEDGYVKFPQRFIACCSDSRKAQIESPIDETGAYQSFFQGLPGRFYAIHVDLALRKDRCALALVRQGEPASRLKCPCNSFNFTGVDACSTCGRRVSEFIKTELPTMVCTLLKEFKPRENAGGSREVDFADVREEILFIRDRNHKIWALSYDGWQSVDSIQTMRKIMGRRKVRERWNPKNEREEDIVMTLSVDKNTEAHDTLKEFIYDRRFFIAMPENDLLRAEDFETSDNPVAVAYREWRGLRIINGKKIDHPIGGSKDFVDALAGAAWHLSKMPIARNRVPLIGGWMEKPVSKR